MTNEQTIEAIMKSARARITSENATPVTVARMPAEEVAALLDEIERLKARQDPVCWAVIDPSGGGCVEYTAAWKGACHQHISDCITEHDIDGAKGWVVRPLYVAPMLAAEPAKAEPGEWIEWAGGECPIADDARIDVKCRDGDVLRDCLPSNLYWSHHADDNYWGDIVAYRVMA